MAILQFPTLVYCYTIHTQAGEAGQFRIVLNCTNFTLPQLKTINLTESACGLVCLLISVIILGALLYYKAYKTTLQRLFLCLMVTTILQEAGLATTVEHQFQYRGQETVCKVIGFSNQCTGTMIYLYTAQIALFILYMVYKQLNGDPFPGLSQSKCSSTVLEFLYAFSCIVISFGESWYPYFDGKGDYGLSLADCWIKAFDEYCNPVGYKYQVVSYCIDEGLGMISVIATVVLVVVYCKRFYVFREVEYPQLRLLLRQTLLLMCFLMSSFVYLSVGIVRFYVHSYPLLLANSTGITVSPLIIPVGYLVYLYATRNPHVMQNGCCRCSANCCWLSSQCHERNPALPATEECVTHRTSHARNIPSNSFFNVEYTGAFTHITEDKGNSHVGEHELLVAKETQYGSINT